MPSTSSLIHVTLNNTQSLPKTNLTGCLYMESNVKSRDRQGSGTRVYYRFGHGISIFNYR